MTGAQQHNRRPLVRRFHANERGRDFVIGDVHASVGGHEGGPIQSECRSSVRGG